MKEESKSSKPTDMLHYGDKWGVADGYSSIIRHLLVAVMSKKEEQKRRGYKNFPACGGKNFIKILENCLQNPKEGL